MGTPFLCACARGAEGTIVLLTRRGCDINAVTDANVGAVTLATSSGVKGALLACLAAGAPTDLRPPGGMTGTALGLSQIRRHTVCRLSARNYCLLHYIITSRMFYRIW